MKRSTLILLKTIAWVSCLSPFGLLVYEAITNTLGPDPTSTITLTTGYNALLLLILSLAVTPLRHLLPRLSWLIKFRRLLGLFAFFYATLHLATYIALYMNFDLSVLRPTSRSDASSSWALLRGFCCYHSRRRRPPGQFVNSAANAGILSTNLSMLPLCVGLSTTGGKSSLGSLARCGSPSPYLLSCLLGLCSLLCVGARGVSLSQRSCSRGAQSNRSRVCMTGL